MDQHRSADVDYDKTVAEIQEVVDGYPGLYRDVLTYLRERIKEVLTGTSATIVVRIFGPDLDELRGHTRGDVRRRDAADVAGRHDLKVEPQVLVPQIDVRLTPECGRAFGLTPGEVRRAATTLVKGTRSARSTRNRRSTTSSCGACPRCARISTAVRELPDRHAQRRPGAAGRRGRCRRSCRRPTRSTAKTSHGASTSPATSRDATSGSVARDIEQRVRAASTSTAATTPSFSASTRRRLAHRRQMLILGISLVAIVGIVLLLYSDFHAWRHVGLVMLTLPFALIGGVVGVLARRREPIAGIARRLRDRAGHRRAQRHHDGQPLPASGA